VFQAVAETYETLREFGRREQCPVMRVSLHFIIDSGREFLYVSSYVGFVLDKWHWDRFSLLSSIILLSVIILRCLLTCLSTPSPVADEMLLFAATPRRSEAIIIIIIIIIIILIALSTFMDIWFNLLSIWYAFVMYLVATIEIYRSIRIHLNDAAK